jgi:hypothetical protein
LLPLNPPEKRDATNWLCVESGELRVEETVLGAVVADVVVGAVVAGDVVPGEVVLLVTLLSESESEDTPWAWW